MSNCISITPLLLSDTFLTWFQRTNQAISTLNTFQIRGLSASSDFEGIKLTDNGSCFYQIELVHGPFVGFVTDGDSGIYGTGDATNPYNLTLKFNGNEPTLGDEDLTGDDYFIVSDTSDSSSVKKVSAGAILNLIPEENRYFYGPTAPSEPDLLLGDKWFNTTVGSEFTYLYTDTDEDTFVWVDIDHLGRGETGFVRLVGDTMTGTLTGTNASFSGITASNGFIGTLTGTNASFSGITASNGFIGTLTGTNASFTSFTATNGFIGTLTGTDASFSGITATNGFIGTLTGTNASFSGITATNGFIGTILEINPSTSSEKEWYDLVVGQVTADDSSSVNNFYISSKTNPTTPSQTFSMGDFNVGGLGEDNRKDARLRVHGRALRVTGPNDFLLDEYITKRHLNENLPVYETQTFSANCTAIMLCNSSLTWQIPITVTIAESGIELGGVFYGEQITTYEFPTPAQIRSNYISNEKECGGANRVNNTIIGPLGTILCVGIPFSLIYSGLVVIWRLPVYDNGSFQSLISKTRENSVIFRNIRRNNTPITISNTLTFNENQNNYIDNDEFIYARHVSNGYSDASISSSFNVFGSTPNNNSCASFTDPDAGVTFTSELKPKFIVTRRT